MSCSSSPPVKDEFRDQPVQRPSDLPTYQKLPLRLASGRNLRTAVSSLAGRT
jgi:hypothetical protein